MHLKSIQFCFIILLNATLSTAQISPIHTATLPVGLSEVSGMAFYKDTLYMHNDGGNPAEIYGLDSMGKLISTFGFSNASNIDWEAMQTSKEGDFLIADFGNNNNSRNDLRFYLVRQFDPKSTIPITVDTIGFSYCNQTTFPPANEQRHFDAEACIIITDSILIFTKNRSDPYNGYSYVHYVPLSAGNYVTELIDSIYTGSGPKELDWITDANWDNNTLWLLSHGFVLRFDSFRENRFANPKKIIFDNFSQKEACAYNKPYLWVADEKHPTFGGGKIYQYLVDTLFTTGYAQPVADLGKWIKVSDSKITFTLSKPADIYCYDISGKQLQIFTIGEHKRVIELSSIQSQTFILQTTIEGILHSIKLTKP